jgi:putative peptide zinc metalloprotease protein
MSSPPSPGTLPSLRQELSLQPGQNALDGSPTWTLHDPANNRFYQLGWPAFEILARWSLGDAAQIVASVQCETTLQMSVADIEGVAEFLVAHHLARARTSEDSARLLRAQAADRSGPWSWLLHHYLFFRIPLLRPERFLARTAGLVNFAYQPRFWWLMAAVALVGLYLVAQRWDSFVHSFTAYNGWQGLLGIGIALSCTKVLHELGHAYTAHRHGCRVPAMGAAFLVLWPVLYTDTNEAWKLASRRHRLQIGAAGMAAELALAAVATLLWSFLPEGPLRAGVFLLSTSTWIITLAINLSPFMRFDGYFLLSDLLNMPNLHERAFAFGRWHLRECLFGLGAPEPEAVSPGRRRFLIAFAWATWIYRLALFFGIALLVYHLFFKLLGLMLMGVELGWFIVLPMVRELQAWWARRGVLRWNTATRRSAIIAAMLLAAIIVPTGGSVHAPAMLQATRDQVIYAAAAAQLQRVVVRPGAQVLSGELLLELVSPDLQAQLALAQAEEQQLRWQLDQQSFDARLQASGTVLRTRWEAAQGAVSGVQALIEQLQIRAPFDGRIVADTQALQPGTWIAKGEALLQVVASQGVRVTAFIDEPDAQRLPPAPAARFVADQPGLARLDCRVATADRINVAALEFPALASLFGGPIPSTTHPEQGQTAVKPLASLLRVRIEDCRGLASVVRELPGTAMLEGAAESLLGRAWRAALALWRRESGL